jgi:6-phosphogluconolactonase (cycloisomerase 2 family)
MKFRNFGRTLLAMAGAAAITLGLTSCSADHTVGYIYVTGTTVNGSAGGTITQLREDNNNGDLVPISGAVGSGGSNPVRMVTGANSRFLYTLNAGTPTTDATGETTGYSSSNITVFSIGGYGQLAQQLQYNSQGSGPQRIAVDGNYLMVLDEYAPITGANGEVLPPVSSTASATFPCEDSKGFYHPTGDITVFAIDTSTGRLSLVQNQRQQSLLYFPVGCFPVDFHVAGSFVYAMDAGSTSNNDVETLYVQAFATTTGQLTPTQTSVLQIGAATTTCDNPDVTTPDITAITGDNTGGHIYLIDTIHNAIYFDTVESSGAVTPVAGAEPVCNSQSQTGGPVQSIVDETGKYVYFIDAGPTNNPTSTSNSDIAGYTLDSGTGYPDTNITTSPYTGIVSNPVCIFEDPTNQYLFVAGADDNSITGRRIDPSTGTLTILKNAKGTYPTSGTPSWCLSISSTI